MVMGLGLWAVKGLMVHASFGLDREGYIVNGLPLVFSWALKPFCPFHSSSPSVQVYDPEAAAVARGFVCMLMRLAATAFVRRLAPARPPVLIPSGAVAAEAEAVTCGRGDKKTKRGKRFKGSFGNARPKREKKIERIKDRVEVPRSTPWPLPFKLI
jgi:30S ribosomal protein S31